LDNAASGLEGHPKTENFEKTLLKVAEKLRKNVDAAEYKHIVLGLVILKYISDSFEILYSKLVDGKGDYPLRRRRIQGNKRLFRPADRPLAIPS
jgi:type I restriction-modification system DNA methylase subunit